jgi:predicted DCC family thiol-disulfide oxidoreductase YuxK
LQHSGLKFVLKHKVSFVEQKILLFDGWCSLCGRTIKHIQKHDRFHQFSFIPIQSDKGQELMELYQLNPNQSDSVILIEKGIAWMKSEAFFRIANQMGGIYGHLLVFQIFPKKLTDWAYDVISRYRYKWFGKNDSCQME